MSESAATASIAKTSLLYKAADNGHCVHFARKAGPCLKELINKL